MSFNPSPPFCAMIQGDGEMPVPEEGLDTTQFDYRLREIDRKARAGMYERKKEALVTELELFLSRIPGGGDLRSTNAQNLRRFLVYKDNKGKTQAHENECSFLGTNGLKSCGCPRRLAAGTVESLIGQLKAIFKRAGRGDTWDEAQGAGNPAYAMSVADYLKVVREESSKAHVTPKQAKPLFLGKLEKICDFLVREVESTGISAREKFTYLRDRAFFSLQFYAGDRASDMSKMLSQEVRKLPRGEGFMIKHTQGKTASASAPKIFTVQRCDNSTVCPVASVEAYIQGAGAMGADLRTGYLFRKVDTKGRVIEAPITYGIAYSQLKAYLCTLGIYDGETPHSLRGGCAVTMRVTGAAKGVEDLKQHMGWKSVGMPLRYSRASQSQDMAISQRLKEAIDGESGVTAREAEAQYTGASYDSLPMAFV